ncbi:MAG: outer membrane beta-barrel protein [Planctomycetota bacterium]
MHSDLLLRAVLLAAASFSLSVPAWAQFEFSAYGGFQSSPHSRVEGSDPSGAGEFNELFGWEGRSFAPPPYYGFRATYWRESGFGYGLEFTHAKVYADDASRARAGFERFEMTDGLNLVTVNGMYRWDDPARRWTPYVGAGFGIAVPHVDVQSAAGRTFGYQATGPVGRVVGGISYRIADAWTLFAEYEGTYSTHDVDLDSGGGFRTDIITNAMNVGVSFWL